jgi:hypothetical protein
VQQAPQIADENTEQQDTAGDIDDEDNVLQAIKIVGALYSLCEQEKRDKRKRDANDRHQGIEDTF